MVRIAYFRRILKEDLFKRMRFLAEYPSARDILDAAATWYAPTWSKGVTGIVPLASCEEMVGQRFIWRATISKDYAICTETTDWDALNRKLCETVVHHQKVIS